MEESDIAWLRPLFIEERKYAYPEHTLNTLVRDLNIRKLRGEFKALEPEYQRMASGEICKDENIIKRYNELLCKLKGSVK
jgi:hypothetical protein